MAVIQQNNGIRYIRRRNLEEEARVIGNYYKDIIQQYGIDCRYWKLNTSEFQDFKKNIDQNTVLKRAYGYDITPVYDISADMVAYAEIDQDIFNLNKYGYNPNTDINLIFDSTQFACDMAPKVGVYKEYDIDRREVYCEVPRFDSSSISSSIIDGHAVSSAVSDDVWPYELGLGMAETYTCGILSGKMRCMLSGYEIGKTCTAVCDPYEHTDFAVTFPANDDLYWSLKYKIENDDYLETMLFLTYVVNEIQDANGEKRYVLSGYTHGSVLFFDTARLGKYAGTIHPMVGDIVEIDFPDDQNREKYEITECIDKQLTQDGINPLLHKYVWKCKARRHVDSYEKENPPVTEEDQKIREQQAYDETVTEEVADEVSMYDALDKEGNVGEDAVYGGYDLDAETVKNYDKQDVREFQSRNYVGLPEDQLLPVFWFGCGSRLLTDGYDLLFKPVCGCISYVTSSHSGKSGTVFFDSDTKWLKATDDCIVFVNVEGETQVLAMSHQDHTREINIDSLYDVTLVENGKPVNSAGD